MKGIWEVIKNKAKQQEEEFLGMLLGTLGASLLGNILTRKKILRTGFRNKEGKWVLKAGYGGYWNKKYFNATSYFNKIWNTDMLSEWT